VGASASRSRQDSHDHESRFTSDHQLAYAHCILTSFIVCKTVSVHNWAADSHFTVTLRCVFAVSSWWNVGGATVTRYQQVSHVIRVSILDLRSSG